MANGAILANSGHFNVEIDIPALKSLATGTQLMRPFVDEYTMEDGRHIYLLADGRLVNLAAAEGHPASVMDMSFANQALCLEYLVKNRGKLEPKVYPVPEEIDKQVARLKLKSMNIGIDSLTPEQEKYLNTWQEGT
jgi:adenosylhomocysteinase